tara:strand:+ start:2531 stop:2926 length:396 start_codon:yes stop_codon:yes gene_type:complete
MKKHLNYIHSRDGTEIVTPQEYQKRKRELVEKHLTLENLKDIPELYDILVGEYYKKFINKMQDTIEYQYTVFRNRYKFYGILEKDDSGLLYYDLLNIIFNNMVMDLDLEIVFTNENYVNMVFDEFQLKNEL